MYTFSRIFLSALLLGSAVTGVAIPEQEGYNGSQLEKRTGSSGCNADNLLRLIRGEDNLSQGLEFCSSWLGKVHTTRTVVAATVTPTITTTEVSTSTSTHLITETATITNTGYATVTNVSTRTLTQTYIIFGKHKKLAKRSCKKPLSDQILSNTYPASRISSACNCLTLEPATTATVYLTETAAPVTTVVAIPSLTETSLTITNTQLITTTFTATVSATTIVYTRTYITI